MAKLHSRLKLIHNEDCKWERYKLRSNAISVNLTAIICEECEGITMLVCEECNGVRILHHPHPVHTDGE